MIEALVPKVGVVLNHCEDHAVFQFSRLEVWKDIGISVTSLRDVGGIGNIGDREMGFCDALFHWLRVVDVGVQCVLSVDVEWWTGAVRIKGSSIVLIHVCHWSMRLFLTCEM